jgi:membrane protease YdiL (CAAX protease family)
MDRVALSERNQANEPAGARSVPWRQVALFLIVTFSFAWVLWGYWVVAMPPGGLVISPAFIMCAIVGGLAPSLAAIVVSAMAGGRAGVVSLFAAARRPVAWPLVLIALLAVPASAAVAYLVQQAVGLQLRWPDPSLLVMALIWPLMAALGEEFGWRGFLTARLVPMWGILPTALTVGLIWGVWHLPADFVGLKGYGDWFWLAFLINGPIVLTAHAIIITWLWHKSGQGMLAALLYHWSVTATAIIAPASIAEGLPGLLTAAIGAGVVWVVAVGLLVLRRADFA